MWHALRAELAYFRPWLLGAIGIAIATAAMTNVLSRLGGEGVPEFVGDGLPAMFMVLSPMIVGFIAQGLRSEERRARLMLAGPLTPLKLGAVMVLLPASLMGLGFLAAAVVLGGAFLILGTVGNETLVIIGSVGAQMFAIVQMGPLAQESTAARRQRRAWATVAGWTGFVAAILLLISCTFLSRNAGMAAQVAVALAVMVGSAAMYAGRTDFTR